MVMDDLEMMRDSQTWPIWPHLPLFRYKDKTKTSTDKEYGYLVCINSGNLNNPVPVVWLGYLGVRSDRGKIEYSSFEELITAGWLVD